MKSSASAISHSAGTQSDIDVARTGARRRKRRRRKHKDIFANIDGVYKIILSELTQKIIGCVAGENVNAEMPWMYVRKEEIQDNLELHDESSEFLPLRKYILLFPRDKILIGYIPDETREYDEFFICVTESATDSVERTMEKYQKYQQARLDNAVNKRIKKWKTQGSEGEVDETVYKNNRPLIEVEVEAQYPIFPNKVQFRFIKAEAARDGYMELRNTEEPIALVIKRRIDAGVQNAPILINSEAQTSCKYPTNSATQYCYEFTEIDDINTKSDGVKTADGEAVSHQSSRDNLDEMLTVNGVIDFYAEDYESLVLDIKTTKDALQNTVQTFMSFMEVNLCKDMMVSFVDWHPLWTGIVAIAYATNSTMSFNSGKIVRDEVNAAVHTVYPVLIWSFVEALKPKLILETPREIMCLNFCDFDEDLLLGGCKNGQIVLWDIKNKLAGVEELKYFTAQQQKYKTYMASLMEWMKNVHDLAVVRTTAISDQRYSHSGAVTRIFWMSPFHEFSNTGKMTLIPEGSYRHSKQFFTIGDDGYIMIWDLLKKPRFQAGGFKQRKLKRIKTKPAALLAETSPYKVLHLNLRPIYRIRITNPLTNRALALSKCHNSFCYVNYEEANPDRTKKHSLLDRIIYKPILDGFPRNIPLEPVVEAATLEGDYLRFRWEGEDFDSGEVVNTGLPEILEFSKYHDGPVMTLRKSQVGDIVLTTGGKVFALWRKDFKGRPFLWRKRDMLYTGGRWSIYKHCKIKLARKDGSIEIWSLATDSKSPALSKSLSSGAITAFQPGKRALSQNLFGVGDEFGVFQLFISPGDAEDSKTEDTTAFRNFIDREVARKQTFLNWQEEWNKRNLKSTDVTSGQLELEGKASTVKSKSDMKLRKSTINIEKKVIKPLSHTDEMIQKNFLRQQQTIRAMVLEKKILDPTELDRRRRPLVMLEEENERKKRKQKQRLKEADNIFKDTVSILFPDAIKTKPLPPLDPYKTECVPPDKVECYERYKEIASDARTFINNNPYEYEFNWKNVLITPVDKEKIPIEIMEHTKRHDDEKLMRKSLADDNLGHSQYSVASKSVSEVVSAPSNEDDEVKEQLE